MKLLLLAAAAILTSSCKNTGGWGVRVEIGYKDATAGVELTAPVKVEPQK